MSPVRDIFSEPLHPYTRLLIASLPSLEERGKFQAIPGLPPSLLEPIKGCSFHPRCPHAMPRCARETPLPTRLPGGRTVACHLHAP